MIKQVVSSYKGFRDGYQIELQLTNQLVEIKIQSEDAMEFYTAQISQKKIKADKNFGFFFETPQEVFKFIESSFNELNVNKDGTLLLKVEMPFGKLTKTIQFKVDTTRKEVDKDSILNSKILKLHKELIQARQQIKSIKQVKEDLAKRADQIIMLKQSLNKFQRILEEKDEVINNIFHELKEINKWKDEKQKQIQQMSKNKRKFIADDSNPHNSKFTQIGNRYKKIVGGSWDILICKHQIEKGEIYKYYIKQIKAGNNGSFMYGIGTSNIKGVNRAQDNKEFIGYYENTGNVYDKGESKKGGSKIKDGETVTMEIDTKIWKIIWYIEGAKEAQTTISGELRNKPFYLALIIFNEDSEIEFI